jgi:hypothetical protein
MDIRCENARLANDFCTLDRPGQRRVAESRGHEKRSLAKVIRAKCLDCCCDQQTEIRLCPAFDCDLWPYRMGKNPFSNRQGVVSHD